MNQTMHPVSRLLSLFGLQLSRINKKGNDNDSERAFRQKYEEYYKIVAANKRGFRASRTYRYQVGDHPYPYLHLELEFSAYHLHKLNPSNILDVGSYRFFIIGLLGHYNVTTLDIRPRSSSLDNENIVTCDAKAMKFPDNTFGAVLSLEALPHLGLGRYGDEFDLDADIKAFNEMVRVLRPGGYLIFSTAITGAHPSIAFNARRNYNYAMIKEFCHSLECVEEKFIDRRNNCYCSLDEITTDSGFFDYYIGCWKK